MAFIAFSQNLNMGGTDPTVAGAGPSAGKGIMLLFVGRMLLWGWLAQQLLRSL